MDGSESNHQGHRERMRRRFMNDRTLAGFSQHEILEMLLYSCYPRINTNELAHRLIECFGSLDAVLSAEPEELIRTGLIGEAPAQKLAFLSAVADYLRKGTGFDPIEAYDMASVRDYIKSWFDGETEETLRVFPVVNGTKLAGCFVQDMGGRQDVQIGAARIKARLEKLGSNTIFLAHNHPFSSCAPSDKDIFATRLLIRQLSEYDITMLDHFIIGNDGICSLRSVGQLFDYE
ncbi:MAG: hypothetical protein IKP95_02650 [Ruminococcus sp.]|nr:hypothetical protein [Ruminococcus sp.]